MPPPLLGVSAPNRTRPYIRALTHESFHATGRAPLQFRHHHNATSRDSLCSLPFPSSQKSLVKFNSKTLLPHPFVLIYLQLYLSLVLVARIGRRTVRRERSTYQTVRRLILAASMMVSPRPSSAYPPNGTDTALLLPVLWRAARPQLYSNLAGIAAREQRITLRLG